MKTLVFLLPFMLNAYQCPIELDLTYPLTLECTGKHQVIYDDGESKSDSRFAKKAQLEEKFSGLIWGNEMNFCNSFSIYPQNTARILINGTEYNGSFNFSYGKKIINFVDVDMLVQSIMEQQNLSSYSLTVLKALAVAIRTDLCSDSKAYKAEDLGYEGTSMLFQYPKIAQAVVETKNQIMTFDDKIFPTTYCKDAAGINANFSSIFRQNTQAPPGNTLPTLTSHVWKKDFSKDQLCQRLNINNLKNISFYKDKQTEKVYAVKIEDHDGPRVILASRFMDILELDSNFFKLSTKDNQFVFEGQGVGLGVGLCLKTAEHLSKENLSFDAILKACYPGMKITVLDK